METIQNFADWQDVVSEAQNLVAEAVEDGIYDGENMQLLVERIAKLPTDKVCLKFNPTCPRCKKRIFD